MSKKGSLRKSGSNSDDLLESIIQSNVTTSSEKALYLVNGLVTAIVPLYLFTAIFGLSLRDYAPLFLVVSGVIAYQISKAYENIFRSVYNSLAQQRGLFLSHVADNQKLQSSSNAQKEISKHEAISFSIVYNNLLFFVLLVFFGFFIFANLSSAINYVLTASVAASLVSISSTAVTKQ